MQIINYPSESAWPDLMRRPDEDNSALFEQVAGMSTEIKSNGDAAV